VRAVLLRVGVCDHIRAPGFSGLQVVCLQQLTASFGETIQVSIDRKIGLQVVLPQRVASIAGENRP
jgi:hypothetical protein